ncbi:solute carrier family 26 member 10-like protein [Leptotrombidium deliense]|uniref:Solute carrier family 26 member 10-like protein n=1 Tax=Leptotrombidium deliense TaxID=299467 RepID=A0A443SEW7_9ACAR|nr:solute carrier family 26 member 10-like protein [Leptotrombidium deliense]
MAKETLNVQFNVPASPSPSLRNEKSETESDLNVYDSVTSNASSSYYKRSFMNWIDLDIKRSNSSNDLKSKIHGCIKKDRKEVSIKELFFNTFPLFDILRNYSFKNDLIIDTTAGITLSILHIPQAIAYSFLIGIGPIYGLYSSFFPVLVYAFLGTAQHNSIGTIAVVDIMLAEIVKRFQFPSLDSIAMNVTAIPDIGQISLEDEELSTNMPHDAVELMSTICLLTGLLQLGMGCLKMGTISLIFSDQLVSGFSCAAAFHVIVSQIPSVLDVKINKGNNGPFHLIMEVIAIVKRISTCNYTSVTISIVIVIVTVIFKGFVEPLIKKRCNKIPVPIDLIAFVVVTLISQYCQLSEQYGVSIMGEVPTGLPMPKMPRISFASTVILDAISIAVITYAFALSLGKIYAKKHKYYTIKPNQEFIALGAANTISSFFGCFVTTASLARTSSMGNQAKTQVAAIVSCAIMLTVLLYFAPALYYLPKCAIAIVICCAQKPLVLQVLDFHKSWKLSRYEGLIWLVTFSSVILLGIDLGLFAGVIFSVLTIVLRFYSPKLRILGQLPYTEIYLDVRQHSATREIFGIKVLQFSSPLFFMNKDMFQESVYKKTLRPQKFKGYPTVARVEALVLDCSSMSFVDTSGVEALTEISNEMHQKGIEVAIAACPPAVISILARSEFFVKSPNCIMYPSVHEAVNRVATPTLAKKIVEVLP